MVIAIAVVTNARGALVRCCGRGQKGSSASKSGMVWEARARGRTEAGDRPKRKEVGGSNDDVSHS